MGRRFDALRERKTVTVDDALADPDHIALDIAYLTALGVDEPDELRIDLERELRASMTERKERAASVADAKASRATLRRVSTNVDAYASRIAANCEPFPDPRDFVPAGESERLILISGPVDGDLRIGEDLLTQGDVLVGDVPVASAGDLLSAQFVHSVLLHDPELTTVPVPDDDRVLAKTMDEWDAASKKWRADFDAVQKRVAGAVADDRMKRQIRQRALALLHGV